ncbi:MAG: Dam family site-specific DNA-(adenine-N6)-methyltransferase [Acutalibacteraceae bacterium]|nr:Dam family site-specific DNA-(adenine-N6)-methyltransferase [Acutalibacteraceae bacterium]
MNSFIGWIGGKNRLKKYIIPLIPEDTERYIEVFGGAGWVLFGKEQHPKQMEVFNDIDGNLINLYRQIKCNCDELQKEVDWLQSRELFNEYRYQIENNIQLTDLQRAARYLYIIKCSFGSTKTSFATAPKSINNIISRLPDYQKRLSKVIIENRGFEQLIKTYDRPKALFYLDPPYVDTEKYYTAFDFKISDHKRLNSLLKSIKGRFILSYNDCELIREMYKDYNIIEINRTNLLSSNTANRSNFKEVIITNY